MPPQYIFTIESLSKAYGKKDVLKNIWLSFYPGAKIGVIGGNGSGKSTLLRIMAGLDKDFLGTARPAPGISIGYVSAGADSSTRPSTSAATSSWPSRRSAPPRPVRRDQRPARRGPGRRRDGCTPRRAGQGPGRHRGRRGVGPRPPGRDRHGRHAPPPRRGRRRHALRRRAPTRRPLQDPAGTARPAPAGRAHQPPRRRERRLAGTPPGGIPRHRRRASPTTATSSTTSPSGSSSSTAGRASPGREITPPGWSRSRTGWRSRRSRKRPGASSSPASWSGSGCRPAPAWPRTGPGSSATSSSPARMPNAARRASSSRSRPGPHLGDLVVQAEGVAKGYGDRLLFENMSFRLPPGGIIGVIGPNGAGKTTLFRMIVGQETPDRGTLRVGDSAVISYVDQNRDALGAGEHRLPGDLRRPGPDRAGQAQGPRPGLRRLVQLQGTRPGEEGRPALRRRAEPGPPGQAAQERRQPPLLDEPTNDLDVEMLRALEEGPDRVRRLRRGHHPRPLVPRPHRHPHPRLRRG